MRLTKLWEKSISLLLSAAMLAGNLPAITYAQNYDYGVEYAYDYGESNVVDDGEQYTDSYEDNSYEDNSYETSSDVNDTDLYDHSNDYDQMMDYSQEYDSQGETGSEDYSADEDELFFDDSVIIEEDLEDSKDTISTESRNLTNYCGQIEISLDHPWYVDIYGNETVLQMNKKCLDYSTVLFESLSRAGFDISFTIYENNSDGDFEIHAGDYICVELPEELSALAMEDGTIDDVLRPDAKESEGNIGYWSFSEENDHLIRFTFAEDALQNDLSGVYSGKRLSFSLSEDVLSDTELYTVLRLQENAGYMNEYSIILPAVPEFMVMPEEESTVLLADFSDTTYHSVKIEWKEAAQSAYPIWDDSEIVSHLDLYYKVENSLEWTRLDDDTISLLNLEHVPEIVEDPADKNIYLYEDLPQVDCDGNPVEYQIRANGTPDGYVADFIADPLMDTIIFEASRNFVVNAFVRYSEKDNEQMDWRDLLRPEIFNENASQKIKLIPVDENDNELPSCYAQEDVSTESFYLGVVYDDDGESGAKISVMNVPTLLENPDGNLVKIKKYILAIENDSEQLPYYECESVEISVKDYSGAITTITERALFTDVEMRIGIVPASEVTESTTFKVNAVYENAHKSESGKPVSKEKSYQIHPNSEESTCISVPKGIDFKFTEEASDVYKIHDYTVTKITEDGEPEISVYTDSAHGTIDDADSYLIDIKNSFTNYAQKVQIEWVDNNTISGRWDDAALRQHLSLYFEAENEDGTFTWVKVDESTIGTLGMSEVPKVSKDESDDDIYAFKNLPILDNNGNLIRYQIFADSTPTGYISEVVPGTEDEPETIFFEKTTQFTTEIIWIDHLENRPDPVGYYKNNLKLYRYIDSADQKELVEIPIDSVDLEYVYDGNIWTYTVRNLPRYGNHGDILNHEYAYVLLQDSDPEHHFSSYNNGSGAYGNKSDGIYNNGKLYNREILENEMNATKVWSDQEKDDRPSTTYTLWRYTVPKNSTDTGIDANFDNASRVVYYNGNQEILMQYTVDKETNKQNDTYTVAFNKENIPDLPEVVVLPTFDDQGNEFVYFIREIIGEDGKDYASKYSAGTGEDVKTYQYGTVDEGIIKNIRKEKAKITVTKQWKAPTHTDDINGAKVKVGVKIGDVVLEPISEEAKNYSELQGEELANAVTIDGFTSSVHAQEKSFYVNAYDDNGIPYDFSEAQIIESELIINGIEWEIFDSYAIGMHDYKYHIVSAYDEDSSVPERRDHSYILTNTVERTAPYTVKKNWAVSVPDEVLEQVQSVRFEITGEVERLNEAGETVKIKTDPIYVDANFDHRQGETPRYWIDMSSLSWYDEEGYPIAYSAKEIGYTDKNNMYHAGTGGLWSVDYSWSKDETTATNYRSTGYTNYFYISKEWIDGNDEDSRKDTYVKIIKKSDVEELVASGMTLKEAIDEVSPALNLIRLTEANTWYSRVVVPSGQVAGDYILLECQLQNQGEAAYPVLYTAEQLDTIAEVSADGTVIWKTSLNERGERTSTVHGSVNTDTTHYDVTGKTVYGAVTYYKDDPSQPMQSMSAVFTNTRSAEVELVIKKKWIDGNNISGDRPSKVYFTLDTIMYGFVPISEIIEMSQDDIENTSTASEWKVVTSLPKYDRKGYPFRYAVKEIINNTDETLDLEKLEYVSKVESCIQISAHQEGDEIDDSIDDDILTYEFSNKKEGFTDASFKKKWNDPAVPAINRPDVQFKLYRFTGKIPADTKENAELWDAALYTEEYDQIWTNAGSLWSITIKTLPKYNDITGAPYTYVAKETMQNKGVTTLGTYEISYPDNQTYIITATSEDAADIQTVTNTITDEMIVSGTKVWRGFKGEQFTAEDLPNPTIHLLRKISGTDQVEKINITRATLGDMDPDNKKNYSFPNEKMEGDIGKLIEEGFLTENGLLPKYAPDGRRYEYSIEETWDTTMQEHLYYTTLATGTIVNTFEYDKYLRNITLTKKWNREITSKKEDRYPALKFNLYRYILSDVTNPDVNLPDIPEATKKAKLVKSITVSAAEFAETSDGTKEIQFQDLLVYSPKGERYGYYITEESATGGPVNGYTVTYYNDNCTRTPIVDDTGKPIGTEYAIDYVKATGDGIDITNHASQSDKDTYVMTENSYDDPKYISLNGSKNWEDYYNSEKIFGGRPEKIDVELYRTTGNQKGQNNRVDADSKVDLIEWDGTDPKPTVPCIKWESVAVQGAESNIWKYTVYNLQQFAPNGEAFTYSIKELGMDKYLKSAQTVSKDTKGGTGTVTMPALVNSLGYEFSVRKNWMDGDNKYDLRPTSVRIYLERNLEGESTWNKIEWEERFGQKDSSGKWVTGLPSDNTDEAVRYVCIDLDKKYVVRNTKDNSWFYTFKNLPLYNKDGKKYNYRCVETRIGSAAFTNPDGTPADEYSTFKAGAYTRSYEDHTEKQETIQNALETTSLYIKKDWVDQNDPYYSRPEKLRFILQKSAAATLEDAKKPDAEWTNVTKDGKTYIVELTEETNWEKELKDLPIITVTDSGEKLYLYFRAIELHDGDIVDVNNNKYIPSQSSLILEAKNYEDITKYSGDSCDWDFPQNKNRNEITIHNRLIPADQPTITATKIWEHPEDSPEQTAVFELLYRRKAAEGEEEGTWHCFNDSGASCKTGTENGCRGNSHDIAEGCQIKTVSSEAEGEELTVKWDNLPKYDRAGNELEYTVFERPIPGYKTEISVDDEQTGIVSYTFTNIKLQDYSVEKIWQNEEYAERTETGFTATFKLQRKIENASDWEDVDYEDHPEWAPITLTSASANDAQQKGTWTNLPMFTVDDQEITYRALETEINGKAVETDGSNGAYVVAYTYGNADETKTNEDPAFEDDVTVAVNRMVYGYVNLSKTAAYLAPNITDYNANLSGIQFEIYSKDVDGTETLYVSDVNTDEDGYLVNEDGKYGKEQKYLIAGSYVLREKDAGADYSVWASGIGFTVGMDRASTTGEHGTAWITTTGTGAAKLNLQCTYKPAMVEDHRFGDECAAANEATHAVNLESRGVISFEKTDAWKSDHKLDTHDGASGESTAYFGVYLDEKCTIQIAGMVPSGEGGEAETKMILTNKAQDGNNLPEKKDESGVLYLRAFSGNEEYPFTLLSGEYYVKEIVAPAGYELDTTPKKIAVAKITTTALDTDLTSVYPDNMATGITDYKWDNKPNVVKLFKLDQFGRNVTLAEDGYLELTIMDPADKTFPTGEQVIRLYQDDEIAGTKADGSTVVTQISYENGGWIITGLLDIDTIYKVSEPIAAVPVNNRQAKEFAFTVDAEGAIQYRPDTDLEEGDLAEEKADPLAARGDDFNNYYKSEAGDNQIVLRDPSKFLKNMGITKIDQTTKDPIQYISFKLYKYTAANEGHYGDIGKDNEYATAVLGTNQYLTTDENGQLIIQEQDEALTNSITECALKYGLDVGKYYLLEVERGASDKYRLANPIFFEIRQIASDSPDPEDHAEVRFLTDGEENSHVSQEPAQKTVSEEKSPILATVTNEPVSDKAKTLAVVKLDSESAETVLSGARFRLTYQSLTDGQAGAASREYRYCVSDEHGVLYETDENYNLELDAANQPKPVDISKKGSYILTEVKAPDAIADSQENYMTPTGLHSDQPITMISFEVTSENTIVNIRRNDGNNSPDHPDGTMEPIEGEGKLVSPNGELLTEEADGTQKLNLLIKNEKTIVSIAKKNDIESNETTKNTKTSDQKSLDGEPLTGAKLQIFEGTEITGNAVAEWTSDGSDWAIIPGTLKENTIYTLHEQEAPVGYLEADDIYFRIFGTTVSGSNTIAQIYVWTGKTKPVSDDMKSMTNWSDVSNLYDQVLTMVDEAIIAPVDLQKVVGKAGGSYTILPGAKFDVYALGPVDTETAEVQKIKLGTAKSIDSGYLVWDTVDAGAYDYGLIYNASQKRVSSADESSILNKTMILRQNENGYQFTETFAPDHAYMDGGDNCVEITDVSYQTYRDSGYNSNGYVDIKNGTWITGRNTKAEAADRVNPPFEAAFELYKYDSENLEINADHNNYEKIGLAGVTFTLSRLVDGTYEEVTDSPFMTTTGGLLHIDLDHKGTYRLVEETPLTGYQKNTKEMVFTVTNDDYQKTLTYTDAADNPDHTVVIKEQGGTAAGTSTYDLPNDRKHGDVTLTKIDKDSNVKLNGVQYRLTRTEPYNPYVDKYYPNADDQTLIVETGFVYENVSTAESKEEITKTSGKAGVLKIEDLQWGHYTLVEIQENDGYILDGKELSFVIDANGLHQTVKDTGEFVGNTKNQLKIQKTDLGTNQLNGAEFKLYKVSKDASEVETMAMEVTSFYTSKDAEEKTGTEITAGDTVIWGLDKGTYVLREELAPEGYEKTKDIIFTISNLGEISNVVTCTVGSDRVITRDADGSGMVSFETALDPSGSVSSRTNKITVKDKPIEVSLTKHLFNEVMLDAARGQASYEITGIFANGMTQETRTFTGNQLMNQLKAIFVAGRTYNIVETSAPAGYEVANTKALPATIAVDEDGNVTVTAGNDYLTADNTSADGIAELVLTDNPIELTLQKVDDQREAIPESDTEIGYAEFTIRGRMVNEEGTAIESNGEVRGLRTTDFEEKLSGRLIAEELYEIEETKAPNGYKVAPVFYIKLDRSGNITYRGTEKNHLAIVTEGEDLIVQDDPTMITIAKVDENGTKVSGARFTLTANTSTDSVFVNMTEDTKPTDGEVLTWTTKEIQWISDDTDATITFTNHLIADVSYKLQEERVKNHEVMVNDIIFHLEKDGKVVIDTNSAIPNNTGYAASVDTTDQVVMTIRNPWIKGSVTFKKYWRESSSAEPVYDAAHLLPDAVYTLTRIEDENGSTVSEEVKTSAKAGNAYAYNPTGTNTRFTTDAQGQIKITDLPEGKYTFTEVNAPAAYHINKDASDAKFTFEIHDSTNAHVPNTTSVYTEDKARDLDTRINAKISLTKYSGDEILPDTVFDVQYSETVDGTYGSIGTMTTEADGKATFEYGKYPDETYPEDSAGEGLRRGFYKLVEMDAPGQMLNKTDHTTRNTIEFQIGNEINKEYVINSDLQTYLTEQGLGTLSTSPENFISLNEHGVINTPIPEKSVTVTKVWPNDSALIRTFRPIEISVNLVRTYNDGADHKEIVYEDVKLEADKDWTLAWENLPAYVNVGNGAAKTTYLYTYGVEEVIPDRNDWIYAVEEDDQTAERTAPLSPVESGVKDGNTTSTITNTLTTHELKINKILGGGDVNDEFKVRIILKKGNETAGNHENGYYLDECKVYKQSDGTLIGTVEPDDAEGWMTIKAGQYIAAEIPEGITYEVEEQLDENGDAPFTAGSSGLKYVPRYDAEYHQTMADQDITTTIRNAVHKYITLEKVNAADLTQKLMGAEYEVSYKPGINTVNPEAVEAAWTKEHCRITEDASSGRLQDEDGKDIDLIMQGTYTIKETKAPEGYITPTNNKGEAKVIATITVDVNDVMTISSVDEIYVVKADGSKTGLNQYGSETDLTVMNEKTRAKIGKTIDYADKPAAAADAEEGEYLAGAVLRIKQPVDSAQEPWGDFTPPITWTTGEDNNPFTTAEGVLAEGVVYELSEDSVPNGYKKADAIYFKLEGTYEVNGIRYSRIVITDRTGTPVDQNTAGTGYGKPGVIGPQLNMVDETIIAPVNLRKILESRDGTSWTPVQDVEFTITAGTDGSRTLGTAITGKDGYLTWKTIENVTDAEENGAYVIYDVAGHRVTEETKSQMIGKRIILRQNVSGYIFTETAAPKDVYNNAVRDHVNYHVKITADHYDDYREGAAAGKLYNESKYINAVEAETSEGNVVTSLVAAWETANVYSSSDEVSEKKLAVNLPYKSTITIHKYDADEEADKADVKDVEFTLYSAVLDQNGKPVQDPDHEGYWKIGDFVSDAKDTLSGKISTDGVLRTGEDGNIAVEIPDKGFYILKETKATGYQLDETTNRFEFELKDNTESGDHAIYGYTKDHEKHELKKDSDGVPNDRQMGTLKLEKQDNITQEPLGGVVYILKRNPDSTDAGSEMPSDYLLAVSKEVETGYKYTPVKTAEGWSWPEPTAITADDGDAGTLIVEGLNWGKYTLTEETENSGYVKSTTVYEFEIRADDLTPTLYTVTNVEGEEQKQEVTNNLITNAKNEVTFCKEGLQEDDSTKKALEGARFEVHKGTSSECDGTCEVIEFYTSRSATEKTSSVISGSDGKVTIYGLPTDTTGDGIEDYHLVETAAPLGYRIAAPVPFTIGRDNEIKVNGTVTENHQVTMTDEPIKVFVKKIGESAEEELTGAIFELTDVCAACTHDHKFAECKPGEATCPETHSKLTITVDDAKKGIMIPVETLIAGHTYELKEIKAPDGYECTAIVTFTVDEDGHVKIVADKTSGGASTATAIIDNSESDKAVIAVTNEKIRLVLEKVDFDDETIGLEGVTFRLSLDPEHADQSAFAEGVSETYLDLATNQNGIADIPLDKLKHGNYYVLTETDLGDDNYYYRFAEDSGDRQITIRVEDEGTLSIVEGKENTMFSLGTIEGTTGNTKVIIKNQKISLKISKWDQAKFEAGAADAKLSGVTLELMKNVNGTWVPVSKENAGNRNGQWVTDASGDILFAGSVYEGDTLTKFAPGTYRVQEINPASGYNLFEIPLILEVGQSGRVTNVAVGDGSSQTIARTQQQWKDSEHLKHYQVTNPTDGEPGGITLDILNPAYSDLEITKKGSDGPKLQGVKFRLEQADESFEPQEATTDSEGIARFTDLPDGEYILTELQTKEGYNLLSESITVSINRNTEVYTASYAGTEETITRGNGTDTISMTVINKRGLVLPATGTTTPQLPKAVLLLTALLEGLALYRYNLISKRRRRGEVRHK